MTPLLTPAELGQLLHVATSTAAEMPRTSLRRSAATLDPAEPKVERRRAPKVDAKDVARILGRCDGEPAGPLVALAIGTGLRRGELLGLRWADVDLEAGTVSPTYQLRRTPHQPGDPARRRHPVKMLPLKTAQSARLIPLPAFALRALRELQARRDEQRRAAKVWAENDLVFADEHGHPLWPMTVTRQAEALLRSVVPGLTLHGCRHVYATMLALTGAHTRTQMGLLGHSNVQQSMDYTAVIPAAAREAVAALDRVVGQ